MNIVFRKTAWLGGGIWRCRWKSGARRRPGPITGESGGDGVIGNDAFRKELLAQIAARRGPEHYGEERRESENEKAERLIAAALKKARWTEAHLEQQYKGHPVKVRLALQLRAETTLTVAHRSRNGCEWEPAATPCNYCGVPEDNDGGEPLSMQSKELTRL